MSTTTTLAVNENGDPYINAAGQLVLAQDIDAIRINCERAAQMILGEPQFNTDAGMRLSQAVWDRYDPAAFASTLRENLLGVQGVKDVQNIASSVTIQGVLQYSCTITTSTGTTTLNSTILGQ